MVFRENWICSPSADPCGAAFSQPYGTCSFTLNFNPFLPSVPEQECGA